MQITPIKTSKLCYNLFFIFIILTSFYFFIHEGNNFNDFFFKDSLDTGMDFFHSLEYVKGRTPYDKFNTLYPPLANLFFYCLFRFIPSWQHKYWENDFQASIADRGTASDLRIWQPTMVLFILFIIISAVLFIQLSQLILNNTKYTFRISIGVLCSYSMLFAFERGNIIIISLLCSMYFLIYRNSSNYFLKELSLIALAIAAGLKIYPALLGCLLLYDRKWKESIRACFYGIASFILPSLAFKEGISCIDKFLHILLNYSSNSISDCKGVSLDKIFNTLIYGISRIFGLNLENTPFNQLPTTFNLVAIFSLILSGFFLNKQWEKILVCILSIILIQAQPIYVFIFMILPLLFFIKEEETLNMHNIVPFFSMIGLQILLPLSLETTPVYSMQFLRLQFFTIILCLYILWILIKKIILKRRSYVSNHTKNMVSNY